jgi:hypothetical protein
MAVGYMKLFLSFFLLLQNVKMTEDFLPLETGNRWVYDVSNEAGQKLAPLDFSVNDRTIVSGRSRYVLSGFPFGGETAGTIRMIGFDREARQFVRVDGDQEFPLFSGDALSTEILESDSSGIPQKFALHTGSTTLVFQRGVGIVEARLQTPDGLHIAKLAGSSIGRSTSSPPPVAPAPVAVVPAPTTAVTTVATVTAENPVLVVSAQADGQGLKLELMVVNTANKLLPFKFNSSRTFDFVIKDLATGREIWSLSAGMMASQVIRSDSIRADSKWTFSEVWNRRDNDRNPVPSGRYQLIGILTSQPPIQSAPVTIEIR